jgi:hypothetical protein
VLTIMEVDERFDPVRVGILSADAVVQGADALAHLIEQALGLGRVVHPEIDDVLYSTLTVPPLGVKP